MVKHFSMLSAVVTLKQYIKTNRPNEKLSQIREIVYIGFATGKMGTKRKSKNNKNICMFNEQFTYHWQVR